MKAGVPAAQKSGIIVKSDQERDDRTDYFALSFNALVRVRSWSDSCERSVPAGGILLPPRQEAR